ncbi:hypothetical protein QDR37_14820 [Amnibacterium sp. CER49]|uniref:hypothetical protein n=1 Tax=Amnibacterium sp. CER49 TaxID=3039161 RepID=UPI00244CC81A|nr:hypothetical protein [Amnibacterium sp. CER49]MDH2445223.1 hypothetical protein [Amnibacterium sp. CER49]
MPLPPALPDQAALLHALLTARLGGGEPALVTVVGNAPLPPSAARAEAIDGSDLVVRMTTFALDRDAPAVGRRTDVVVLHRGVSAGPDTFARHRERLYLLAEPGRDHWEPEARPAWWPLDLELVPIGNREFTDPLRRALGYRRRSVSWPTTGTLAVHLLRRLFPHARLLLTGTSLVDGPRGAVRTLGHHWGPAVSVTPEHRLDREGALLTRWRAEGAIEVLP